MDEEFCFRVRQCRTPNCRSKQALYRHRCPWTDRHTQREREIFTANLQRFLPSLLSDLSPPLLTASHTFPPPKRVPCSLVLEVYCLEKQKKLAFELLWLCSPLIASIFLVMDVANYTQRFPPPHIIIPQMQRIGDAPRQAHTPNQYARNTHSHRAIMQCFLDPSSTKISITPRVLTNNFFNFCCKRLELRGF